MVFNPNIPNLNNDVSSDIPAISTNFTVQDALFGLDHFAFDYATTPAFQGLHQQVTFPQVRTTPILSAGQGSVYTKTIAGRTEFCYTSSSAETQITSAGLPIWKAGTIGGDGTVQGSVFNAGPLAMSNGHGFTSAYGNMLLPTGLEFKWGWVIPTGGAVDGVTFTYPAPFATNTINVQIIPIRNDGYDHLIRIQDAGGLPDVTQNRFTCASDSSGWSTGFYYFAIGY